jgi:tetratricopeptide (TPR) repeat protein
MRSSAGRFLVAAACLLCLAGCSTSTKLSDLIQSKSSDPATTASATDLPPAETSAADPLEPTTTGSIQPIPEGAPPASNPKLLGSDPYDDLSLGKKYYRTANFGLAERHFRRAVETHPRDAEAWVGLAASYDRLRRFDLADRAYKQAIAILGPTPEILNNRGYSYMLRGDYVHARETLLAAQAADPQSPYIKNNLELLEESYRSGKAVN